MCLGILGRFARRTRNLTDLKVFLGKFKSKKITLVNGYDAFVQCFGNLCTQKNPRVKNIEFAAIARERTKKYAISTVKPFARHNNLCVTK